MNLAKPSYVKHLLQKHDLRPSKGRGQNFLVAEHYLARIVAAAELEENDQVIEVGPGLGVLTQRLAQEAGSVIAVEKDRKLQTVLEETLSDYPNVQVIFGDALEVNYRSLLAEKGNNKVVANLPYYITTPLIMNFLESGISWRSLVFLVQKEVAERMIAPPGGKDYGALSVAVQYRTRAEIFTQVPPSAFYPPPKVASAVVRLYPQDTARYGLQVEDRKLFRVVKAAFGQRRKTMLNSISAGSELSRDHVGAALDALGWSRERRGETLSVQEFVQLTNQLFSSS